MQISFSSEDLYNLCLVNKDFANIVPKVLCWLRVDFTSLCNPCLGYEQQDHIDPHRMEMASVAMIHFGLDPGKLYASCRPNIPANIGMLVVP